jgi:hypothetical protein
MSTQLDLDDVAATSDLAKQQLAELRYQNRRMRALLEGMEDGIVQVWAVIGKE